MSLKSAKDVQEHIHRREEKELIRQLTKLQEEKTRRHPDMINSRSHSRTNSRLSTGSRADSNTNVILQLSPSKGQSLSGVRLAEGNSFHKAKVSSRSQLTGPALDKHGTAKDKLESVQPGIQRGKSSHQALMNRRQSTDLMRQGIGYDPGHLPGPSGQQFSSISDLIRSQGGLAGVGSKHTSIGVSPQQSSVVYDATQGHSQVHQPAGYGHTIKEYVNREGLNKKRPHHSYMDPKGGAIHRRISSNNMIEDRMKGSHLMLARSGETGSRYSLHQQAPRVSSHFLAGAGPRARESGHVISGSSHGMAIPSRFLLSKLFSGQTVLEETPDQEREARRQSPVQTLSDHSSGESTESETVLKLECHDDLDENDHPSRPGSDNKVHFKEDREQGEEKVSPSIPSSTKATRKDDKFHRSDHVVTARKPLVRPTQEESHESKRKFTRKQSKQGTQKPIPGNHKKSTSKSAHVVKLNSDSKHEDRDSTREYHKKAESKDASHNHIHIPIEVLNDLRLALQTNMKAEGGSGNIDELLAGNIGSSTAYDPSSNSVQNRRFRARLRALQFVSDQVAAQKQQRDSDHAVNFDPLQILRCRYLRLSQSNIDTLKAMCRESGIEVGIHPHMNLEDIGSFVFGDLNKSTKSGASSSTSVGVKQVLI